MNVLYHFINSSSGIHNVFMLSLRDVCSHHNTKEVNGILTTVLSNITIHSVITEIAQDKSGEIKHVAGCYPLWEL